jgi:hypothetical protein
MFRLFFYIAVVIAVAIAQNDVIDEDAMFSDTNTVVSNSTIVASDSAITAEVDQKRVGFSGGITTAGLLAIPLNFIDSSDSKKLPFSTFAVGNVLLDIRLINGIKAFANLEAQYTPSGNSMMVGLREIFVDANIKHRIYLRAGKQVLQWGRCNFFNPTDLINVEKKLFIQKIGYREGAFGLKAHIPFGTRWNLYGFVDTKNATDAEGIAGAAKIELLAGGTELALSAWGKRMAEPVFGFDLSSRLLNTDISAEASVSYGDNQQHLEIKGDSILMVRKTDNALIPRVAVGLTRTITVGGVPDRLMLIGEVYYNHAGYDENGFSDTRIYTYEQPVAITRPGTIVPEMLTNGTETDFLNGNKLFESNNYGKYYAAFFSNFSRFFTSEMTLQCNALVNIAHQSATLTTAINYQSLSDFSMNLMFLSYLGEPNTEFTLGGNRFAVRLTAGLVF